MVLRTLQFFIGLALRGLCQAALNQVCKPQVYQISAGTANGALHHARNPNPLLYLQGQPGQFSIAHVQRGPSQAARCASTEDNQAPSPPLSRPNLPSLVIVIARLEIS